MVIPRTVQSIAGLKELVGQELGVGRWLEITQERVNAFADVTGGGSGSGPGRSRDGRGLR
jgi:acyl dehydratase